MASSALFRRVPLLVVVVGVGVISALAGGRGAYYNSRDGYRSNVQFGGFDQLDDFQTPPAGASTNNLAARYENIYTARGGRGGRASNDASLQQQQQQQQTGG